MNQTKFWEIIAATSAACGVGQSSYLAILADHLAQLTPLEIVQWDTYFDAYLELANKEKIWAGAFLLNKGNCHEDEFSYFRAWLISMGEDYYYSVLADVDHLALLEVNDPSQYRAQFEALIYVAEEVFIAKVTAEGAMVKFAGEQLYFAYREQQALNEEDYFNLKRDLVYSTDINFVWDEKTKYRLKSKLPQLWQKYADYLDKNALKYEPLTEEAF